MIIMLRFQYKLAWILCSATEEVSKPSLYCWIRSQEIKMNTKYILTMQHRTFWCVNTACFWNVELWSNWQQTMIKPWIVLINSYVRKFINGRYLVTWPWIQLDTILSCFYIWFANAYQQNVNNFYNCLNTKQ